MKNITIDLSTYSSNIDVGFHQLTEQFDTGSLSSLLLNMVWINPYSVLEIEKNERENKPIEETEEIEEDKNAANDNNLGSKEEFSIDEFREMNPFEFQIIKNDIWEIHKEQRLNNELSNRLVIKEFEMFLDMRVENDNAIDLYDIFNQTKQVKPFEPEFYGNSPQMDFGFDGGNFDHERLSQGTEVQYSVEGGELNSNANFDDSSSQNNLFNSANRYELDSNDSSFVPGGDGIFKETSFLAIHPEGDDISVISSNDPRRILSKLRRIDYSKETSQSSNVSKPKEKIKVKKVIENAVDIMKGLLLPKKNVKLYKEKKRHFTTEMLLQVNLLLSQIKFVVFRNLKMLACIKSARTIF